MAQQKTLANSTWDPVLLISQIVSIQTLHYLTLSLLIPPLLTLLAEPNELDYEGGAASVGMLMDWREMAGRPTVLRTWNETLPSTYSWVWRSGSKTPFPAIDHTLGTGSSDPYRGWIIAASWLLACSADIYYLYTFVRRPRMILDFALTLVFNHLVLTTYYSATIPTSLFFWAILVTGATITIIAAEQLCVKREMTEGLNVGPAVPEEEELEMEAGQSSRTRMP